MRSFFAPRSVAVIGASQTPTKAGHVIVRNLRALGYQGAVHPIHPTLERLHGYDVRPSLVAVPGELETVVVAVPRERVAGCLREAAARGARAVIVVTAGFADAGDEPGRALDAELRGLLAGAPFRMMGPNSIGTLSPADGFTTSITSQAPLTQGRVSFFGQSGMFASGLADMVRSEARFGVARVACLGNKLDVDELDLLEFLGDDPRTGVIGGYFEGLRDERRFLELARRVAARKPLVVLKSGRSELGRRAAAGHTGTLSGEDAVFAGAFRQAGLVRAEDLEDFFDLLEGFGHLAAAPGGRVAVVSITGLGCVLAADAAEASGLSLPPLSAGCQARMRAVFPPWAPARNPVDMWAAIERSGVEAAYTHLARAALEDPAFDALVLVFTLIPEADFDAAALVARLRAEHPDKALAAVFMGGEAERLRAWSLAFRRAGVPVYPSPRRALRVLAALATRAGLRS
ncbi:MAG TPA: CoA-binding protein [Myxococcota bacterium]|nr:CoA-binding protein [Myxococcota bacterium]